MLDRCARLDHPVPDYITFATWYIEAVTRERSAPPKRFDEDWSKQDTSVAAVAILAQLWEEMRAATASDLPPEHCERRRRQINLLESVLRQGTRGNELTAKIRDGHWLTKAEELTKDLDACTPIELRGRFFDALGHNKATAALEILGALRVHKKTHDPGELDYLTGLCHFQSSRFSEAAESFSQVPPSSLDHPEAALYLAECYAFLGDVHSTLGAIRQVGAARLTSCQLVYLGAVLAANADDPALADQEFASLTGGQTQFDIRCDDPACSRLVSYGVRRYLEFRGRYGQVASQTVARGYTADGEILRAGHDAVSRDKRLTQLAASALPVVAPALERASNTREEAHALVSLLEQYGKDNTEIVLLSYTILFRLELFDDFLKNFWRDFPALSQAKKAESVPILSMAYQLLLTDNDPRVDDVHRALALHNVNPPPSDNDVALVARRFPQLTEMGRKIYEAAALALRVWEQDDHQWHDAGMIALGFFRILEIELNAKLIKPVVNCIPQELFEEQWKSLPRKAKDERPLKQLKKPFEKMYDGSSHGFTLETVECFLEFARRSISNGIDGLGRLVRRELECLLSQEGVEALGDASLEELIAGDKREKYRNPPAHTRFLTLDSARECQQYVDDSLRKLQRWVKS